MQRRVHRKGSAGGAPGSGWATAQGTVSEALPQRQRRSMGWAQGGQGPVWHWTEEEKQRGEGQKGSEVGGLCKANGAGKRECGHLSARPPLT